VSDGTHLSGAVRVGVDIGGTFTDVILVTEEAVYQAKVQSTPRDFTAGVLRGLRMVLEQAHRVHSSVSVVVHGTTVATNAILERSGGTTALITTLGFRDVLEIGRLRHPTMSDIFWQKPPPLVPRRLRFEVDERVASDGQVLTPLDRSEVDALVTALGACDVQSVAVCLLNSYANPDHEQAIGRRLGELLPGVYVSTSAAVLPEIKEYERTSTTVVNAYIQPIVERYLRGLDHRLAESGVAGPLLVMQSSGGLLDAATACSMPVQLVESGPAAGVIATRSLARRIGLGDVIAFDMGGTTAKASLIEHGEPFVSTEYEVGGGMSSGRSLMRGGGYAIRTPSIDVSEVGAGGGSICWIDAGGAPRVGPRSAGADPGPACYARGGEEPTLTDALVVLGYLSPTALAGGVQSIAPERAEAVIGEKVAQPLRLGLHEAALGIYRIAVANMCRAVRSVTSQRGRDPRDHALVAFGGAGPAHAVEIARSFEISTVVVPRTPGLFSAAGLLVADVERYDVWSYPNRDVWDAAAIEAGFRQLEERAASRPLVAGGGGGRLHIERYADLRYLGQSYELRVPVPGGELSVEHLEEVRNRFHAEHEHTYGHRSDEAGIEIVNLRTRAGVVAGARPRLDLFEQTLAPSGSQGRPLGRRRAYFGTPWGAVETPVVSRDGLSLLATAGPVIIEDPDATTIVPPGCEVRVDRLGNVMIRVGCGDVS
jgi:N-methylhydantoinase A